MAITTLEFLTPSSPKPSYIMQTEGGEFQSSGEYWAKDIFIEDARELNENFSLNTQGFELLNRPTRLINLHSSNDIEELYLPETSDIIQTHLGAKWVHAYDYTIRTSHKSKQHRSTASRVHNDYSQNSAEQKFRDALGDEFQSAIKNNRLMQLNFWRPFTQPVRVKPLAIADARTINPTDLISCDVIYPERRGENYEVLHNSAQRWLYFSNMMKDEALLFKGYDSLTDGTVRFTPHSSFDHPDTPTDAPARWSIEVRLLVIV